MAFTTNTKSYPHGIYNRAVGRVVSDAGAATAITLNIGFVPRHFRIINLTDRITDEWFEGMAAASSLHAVAAGTLTLETTNGVTVAANGDVTLTAVTMAASKSFFWEAQD